MTQIEQLAMTLALYTTVRLVQTFKDLESRDAEPWSEKLGIVCFPANGAKVSMTAEESKREP